MAKIQIIVGSVNGRALQTAAAVAHVLNRQGHETRLNTEPTTHDLQQNADEALLVCCSTTGNGELPSNLYPLFFALDEQTVDLKDRIYGIIALGDSGYEHFAQAGYMMENALYLSGAKRVGEICALDARKVDNQPLTAALWANEWVSALA